jgi:energy-coupling factor transporter ATP-binding protein EcfA2
MIEFDRVTFTYDDAVSPTLRDVSLRVDEGELCVVIGPTGSGKSTLLRAVNGLVPHFSGGHLRGTVRVAGHSTADEPPRELASLVGFVGQNPAAGFVTDNVEDELAYTMENLGVAGDAMRRRVEDVLDLLGLHAVRSRPLRELSGGQCQRVAIGSVLAASPRALVLDEPTSALDPAAAEEVLAALARLVGDLGLTVLVAEHRLERVLPFADSVVLVPGDGAPLVRGDAAAVMADSPLAPPIVELGRLAGWDPLPLSVRDARRQAAPLRDRLAAVAPEEGPLPDDRGTAEAAPALSVRGLVVDYGPIPALRGVDLAVPHGEIVALMGRNGSGKSTLLAQLAGLRAPGRGTVRVGGRAPHELSPKHLVREVALVPQDAALLLEATSVDQECTGADRDAVLEPGTTGAVLATLTGTLDPARHPRDLSEGQRLALALAVVLGPAPPVLLLDEPTRGLDYTAKAHLAAVLRRLATEGHCVVVATHDVELAASMADRAVVLADGEVVADGPAREVVCHSPVFAPQVAKILAPEPWLTVAEVRRALAEVAR